MVRRVFVVICCMYSTMWSSGQVASNAQPRLVAPLRPLLEALHKANVSGSLEFSGHCDIGTPPDFPHFHTPSTTAGTPLKVARETFADDPAMQVTQDADGTIRMIEDGIPRELLNVKIRHISFEANGAPEQFTAFSANAATRHAILQAPEVVAFMKARGIQRQVSEGTTGRNAPEPLGSRHISGSLDDVTLSHALDAVLKTFPGIWVYESCPRADGKGQFVDFFFLDLHNPGLFEEWNTKAR